LVNQQYIWVVAMSIDVERQGSVLLVTMNRPESLNALDPDHLEALREALRGFRDDGRLRVAVLTGTGRAFSVGADLKNVAPPRTSFAAGYFAARRESVDAGVHNRALLINELGLTKPLIAAVNGFALGGGCEIALSADLRVAGGDASFGLPEARRASVPGLGGSSLLLRAIPRAVAMKMILTGDRIDADTALRYGLISDVYEPDSLVEEALKLAQRVAANGPLAVQALKVLSDRTEELTRSQSIELEKLLWGLLRDTDDRREGRAAFAERREPRYEGR
jgi:E-phenylitaconyl-CoA hydratase